MYSRYAPQRHLPSIIDKAIDSKNEIHSAPLGHSKKESSIYHRIDEHKLIRFLPTLACKCCSSWELVATPPRIAAQ
jgi:hypothetical protein